MKKATAKAATDIELGELPFWRYTAYGLTILLAVLILFGLALAIGDWQKQIVPSTTSALTKNSASDANLLSGVPAVSFSRKNQLLVGENDAMQYINPLYATGDGELDAVSLIFESLVRLDEQGQPLAQLAESWQFDQNTHQLVFILYPDHAFRDGRTVSSSDIVFTYQSLLEDSYDGPMKGRLTDILAVEAGKSANEVIFTLADWVAAPDYRQFTVGILNSDYYIYAAGRVFEIREKNPAPEGSGAFYLKSSQSGLVVLEKRAGYGGTIAAIELRQVASEDKFSMLQNGELDIVRNLWDTRMQERAAKLPGYTFNSFETSVDSYFLVNPDPKAANIIQRPSQRLSILLTAAQKTLSGLQQNALLELAGQQLTLYYFQGLDTNILHDNREKADQLAARLKSAGLSVQTSGSDWPDLIGRANSGDYDILLLPATANSRLPKNTLVLSEPVQPGASAFIAAFRPEVFIASNRLAQITINPLGHPFAAAAGTWTDRIENIRVYNSDGSYWEEENP